MRDPLWLVSLAALLLVLLADYMDLAGETEQHIDDAWITAAVKGKLSAGKVSRLSGIAVDTQQGIVYLSGTAENAAMGQRAVDLARRVQGVREAVSDLRIQGGWVDSPDDRAA